MVYWIAKIYGEELTAGDAVVVLGGLSLGGTVLKAAALEACNFIPIAGWLVKSAIAASAIEGIGHVITKHFEDKYPRKIYTVDPDVESSVKRR